jgi:hypothetical protein
MRWVFAITLVALLGNASTSHACVLVRKAFWARGISDTMASFLADKSIAGGVKINKVETRKVPSRVIVFTGSGNKQCYTYGFGSSGDCRRHSAWLVASGPCP